MLKLKNTQTAVEYLIILAIILLISVIVMSILFDFSGFTGIHKRSASSSYWENADIGIMQWTANGTNIRIIIRNNLPYAFELQNITLNSFLVNNSAITFDPGEENEITGAFDAGVYNRNEPYEADVIIAYKNLETSDYYYFYGQAPLEGIIGIFN